MRYKYAHPEFFDGVPRPDFKSLSDNLVIYGAGFQGLLAAYLLDQQGIKALCFGDQDVKKQGTTYYGLPVYSPEEMKKRYPDALAIVTPYSIRPAFQYVRDELGYGERTVTPFSLFLEFDSIGFDDLPEIPDWYHSDSLPYHMEMFFRKCINLLTDESFFSLDICVSEVCNLRCKNCTSLMPCYQKPRHFELEDVFQDINTVLCERKLHHLAIEGGETFLWKPLPNLLRKLCKLQNLIEIIVITNGTILPDSELLKALRHPKVVVQISDYGAISRKDELLPILKKEHISYWLTSQKWSELSAFHKEKLCGEELSFVVNDCCKLGGNGDPYLVDGMLFRCPIQGNLHRLNIYKSDPKDFVDIRQSDTAKVQREISEFMDVKQQPRIIELCRHCNGRGHSGIEVPPAEQLAPGEKIQVRFE